MTLPVRSIRNDMGRWEPARAFDRLTQQLSRLFDEQWADLPAALADGFTPLADVEETDDAYVLEVELPGVKKSEISIDIDGRRLVITGERPEQKRSGWLRRQSRSWGRFRYEIVVADDIDEDAVEATLHDGVLRVTVPKRKNGQHRRVEVK